MLVVVTVVVVGLPDPFLRMRARINSVKSQYSDNLPGTRLKVCHSDVDGQVQGGLARVERCPVIQNYSCCTKESRLDQSCGVEFRNYEVCSKEGDVPFAA